MLQRAERDDERAVSPVIGVILMVAITVILASTIAVFVLGFGEQVDGRVNAGATVDFDAGNDEITVTYVSAAESSTSLSVAITEVSDGASDPYSGPASKPLASVGDSFVISPDMPGVNDGDRYRIVVTAENGEKSTVVTEKTETI